MSRLVRADAGDAYDHLGLRLRMRLTGGDTAGGLAVIEHVGRQGAATPLHRHPGGRDVRRPRRGARRLVRRGPHGRLGRGHTAPPRRQRARLPGPQHDRAVPPARHAGRVRAVLRRRRHTERPGRRVAARARPPARRGGGAARAGPRRLRRVDHRATSDSLTVGLARGHRRAAGRRPPDRLRNRYADGPLSPPSSYRRRARSAPACRRRRGRGTTPRRRRAASRVPRARGARAPTRRVSSRRGIQLPRCPASGLRTDGTVGRQARSWQLLGRTGRRDRRPGAGVWAPVRHARAAGRRPEGSKVPAGGGSWREEAPGGRRLLAGGGSWREEAPGGRRRTAAVAPGRPRRPTRSGRSEQSADALPRNVQSVNAAVVNERAGERQPRNAGA